ncbi:MAG: HAD family hydrolase, partial [Prevotella sp.]
MHENMTTTKYAFNKLNALGIEGIIFDYGATLDTNGDHWGQVIWHAYQ